MLLPNAWFSPLTQSLQATSRRPSSISRCTSLPRVKAHLEESTGAASSKAVFATIARSRMVPARGLIRCHCRQIFREWVDRVAKESGQRPREKHISGLVSRGEKRVKSEGNPRKGFVCGQLCRPREFFGCPLRFAFSKHFNRR
jgi:hypothetical protein